MTTQNSAKYIATKALELHFHDAFFMLFRISEWQYEQIQKAIQVQKNVNAYEAGTTIIPAIQFELGSCYLYQIENDYFAEHFSHYYKTEEDIFNTKIMKENDSDFLKLDSILKQGLESKKVRQKAIYTMDSRLTIDKDGFGVVTMVEQGIVRVYSSPFIHITNLGLCKPTNGKQLKLITWVENIGKFLKSMKKAKQ